MTRLLLFPLLTVATLTLPTPAAAQIVNPGNGHTYFETDVNVNMALARAQATLVGGYVVAINDAAEEAWIDDNFSGVHWIGLSDEVVEGVFLWDSGEPFVYENWGSGQPDNLGDADFVERYPSGWRDEGDYFDPAIIETELPLDPSVENLACEPVGTTAELSWTNPIAYSVIEVYRDGQLIATLPGDATTFVDDPAPGRYLYWLLPMGTNLSRPVSCWSRVANDDFLIAIEDAEIPDDEPGTARVLMTNLDDLASWSYGICHDTSMLTILDVTQGSALADVNDGDGPDFYSRYVCETCGGFAAAVIIEFLGGDVFPSGAEQEVDLALYEADVPAVVATALSFCETIGSPRVIISVFTAGPGGSSFLPLTEDGVVTITAPAFIRGDFDGDGLFDGLVDGVASLSFQFLGGASAPCLEAADSDGNGVFHGLVDSLHTLGHQFQGGPPPPAPYPDCGIDPDPATSLGCPDSTCP